MEKQEHNFSKRIYAIGVFIGIALIFTGGFFLIPRIAEAFPSQFPDFDPLFVAKYWPILLIVAGIMIICHWFCFPNLIKSNAKCCKYYTYDYSHEKNSGYFHRSSVFSNGLHVVAEPIFHGGEIDGVFGSMTLDLRKTDLAEGVDTVLRIHAVFGEVKIYVPENWNVMCRVNGIFGNFIDRRINIVGMENGKRLIIEGECIFGSGMLQSL